MPKKNSDDSNKRQLVDDFESLSAVAQIFLDTPEYPQLVQKVVDSVLIETGKLGHNFNIAVLALKNKDKNILERVSMSHTQQAKDIRASSATQFEEIQTPLSAKSNYCIRAMEEKTHLLTHNFYDILHPPFSKKECLKLQEAGKINTSVVFPVIVKGESTGMIIFSTKQHIETLSDREATFIKSLANIIGIAVENSNLFEALEKEQEALKQANEKLKELDRTKDDFLSVASHELRTPMTIIKSYIWMLQSGKRGKLNSDQQRYIDTAMKGTERLINLVNDMLNISRIEQGRMEFSFMSVNLPDCINETIDGFNLQAKDNNIYITLENHSNTEYVYADESKLKEIITNLVGNSMKFTKQGGITVYLDEEGDNLKISVTDTGVGINEQDLPALFKKFGRLDNSYTKVAESGGTGLGLHIVKLYTEKMGGRVGAYSEGEGKGSTFWFTLPKYKPNRDTNNKSQENNDQKETNQSITENLHNENKKDMVDTIGIQNTINTEEISSIA